MHRSLTLFGPEHEQELMIDRDGIHAVEQFVLAKYYLTTSVYRHRVRLITDQMLIRAIRLGIDDDGLENVRRLYSFDGSSGFYANYLAWDDARFVEAFGGSPPPGPLCGELLARLRQRQLLKRVFQSPIDEFGDLGEYLLKLPEKENASLRTTLETSIAGVLPKSDSGAVDPRLIIVHVYTIRSVKVSSRNDEAGIMVFRDQNPQPFEQVSALFRSINEGYTEGYVEVYAPVDWFTETEKKKVRRDLERPIRACIEAMKPTAAMKGET